MREYMMWLFLLMAIMPMKAQTAKDEAKLTENLRNYFATYKPKSSKLTQQPRLVSCQVDNQQKTITVVADEFFAAQEFTPDMTAHIYKKLKGELPKVYRKYELKVVTNGMSIDDLIPNRLSQNADKSRMWGDIEGSHGSRTFPAQSSSPTDCRTAISHSGPATATTTTKAAATGGFSAPDSSAPPRTSTHRPSSFPT